MRILIKKLEFIENNQVTKNFWSANSARKMYQLNTAENANAGVIFLRLFHKISIVHRIVDWLPPRGRSALCHSQVRRNSRVLHTFCKVQQSRSRRADESHVERVARETRYEEVGRARRHERFVQEYRCENQFVINLSYFSALFFLFPHFSSPVLYILNHCDSLCLYKIFAER